MIRTWEQLLAVFLEAVRVTAGSGRDCCPSIATIKRYMPESHRAETNRIAVRAQQEGCGVYTDISDSTDADRDRCRFFHLHPEYRFTLTDSGRTARQ